MPEPDHMEGRPATIVLAPIGGISGDMFLAAVLDAWPAFAKPVLDAVHAALPAGHAVSLVRRSSGGGAAPRASTAGNGGPTTGRSDTLPQEGGQAPPPPDARVPT